MKNKDLKGKAKEELEQNKVLLINELDKIPQGQAFEALLLEYLEENASSISETSEKIESDSGKPLPYLDPNENNNQERKGSDQEQTISPMSDLDLDSLEFLDFKLPENLIKEIDAINQPSLALEAPQEAIQEPSLQAIEQTNSSTPESSNTSPNRLVQFASIVEEKANKLETDLRAKVSSFSNRKRKVLGYSMIIIGSMLATMLVLSLLTSINFTSLFAQSTSKDTFDNLFSKIHKQKTETKQETKELNVDINEGSTSYIDGKATSTNTSIVTNLSDPSLIKWQPTHSLLASTPKRRKMLAKELGIDKGEWILACFSVDCGDCDRAALKLNQLNLKSLKNVIAITKASSTDATLWKERLGLKYEVKSVSEQSFEDTGTVLLPTIIKLKDGEFVGAVESLEENHDNK